MNIRSALIGQYHGALAMLKQTIDDCPDDHWASGPHPVPFWQVVYHTLFFTHLYLQPTEADFKPWERHRPEYYDLPWPPGSGPKLEHPYTKADLLEYWLICDRMVDDIVPRLDLDASESGFPWLKTLPKLEHQIYNIRHIQHHAGFLAARVRAASGTESRWVRSTPAPQ